MTTTRFAPVVEQYASKLKSDLKILGSSDGDAQGPEQTLDLKHPLSHYYISSSHNTYLSGHQLYGRASAAVYQSVLDKGCRCVEIDVWDGEELSSSESSSDEEKGKVRAASGSAKVGKWRVDRVEPRVVHGHTATKECSFRDVAEAIGLHAFTQSDTPLIVSLEVHASHEQQEVMVEIIRENWGPYLLPHINWTEETPLPPLKDIRKRILVKVKYSPPKRDSKADKLQPTRTNESSEDESQAQSVKQGKIIPELGEMGVYTRSHHFANFEQHEAKIPTHIFSMSESKFSNVHSKEPKKLFQHNMNYMLRAYPKGTRVSSSNLDPAPFWRQGAQIVALNWQYINEGTMLNHAMFVGTPGYVLKPPGYYPSPTSSTAVPPIQRGKLDLTIELFAGQSLGPPNKKLRAYVKCELHVEQDIERQAAGLPAGGAAKEGEYKRRSSTCREGRDADFGGLKMGFSGISGVTEDLTFVRFKVMDDERLSRDEMVGWACYRLKRLREGVRLVHVLDPEGRMTDGRLLVRVTKKFTPN